MRVERNLDCVDDVVDDIDRTLVRCNGVCEMSWNIGLVGIETGLLMVSSFAASSSAPSESEPNIHFHAALKYRYLFGKEMSRGTPIRFIPSQIFKVK